VSPLRIINEDDEELEMKIMVMQDEEQAIGDTTNRV
jgi:hypothetical protein